jgi:hypothetical protein
VSPDNVLQIEGDGPNDPGHGDAVEAEPRRVPCHSRCVEENVVVEDVAAEGEENLVPPAGVGGRRGVENDGDQVLDVGDPGSLKVEIGDHGIRRVVPGASTRGEQRPVRSSGRRGARCNVAGGFE